MLEIALLLCCVEFVELALCMVAWLLLWAGIAALFLLACAVLSVFIPNEKENSNGMPRV